VFLISDVLYPSDFKASDTWCNLSSFCLRFGSSTIILPFKSNIICWLNFGPIPGNFEKNKELDAFVAFFMSRTVALARIGKAPFGPQSFTLISSSNISFSACV
jgi:hypothetical protein